METKIKLFFDPVGNTLTVWFGDILIRNTCAKKPAMASS